MGQGITVSGDVVSLSTSFSGTALEIIGTASGRILHAQDQHSVLRFPHRGRSFHAEWTGARRSWQAPVLRHMHLELIPMQDFPITARSSI